MFDIVALVGGKGGVGKTLCSHATAQGLAMCGLSAAYCLTDVDRPLLPDENRSYAVLDGRTVSELQKQAFNAKNNPANGFLIIDGGGNRGPVDELIVKVADVVILPFTADEDSVAMVLQGLATYPNAWALPNNWTTSPMAQTKDNEFIERVKRKYPKRVLPTSYNTHALIALGRSDFDGQLLTPARMFCRVMAGTVLTLLGRDHLGELVKNPAKQIATMRAG
jgi:cellulose biosynthesis protein BcsQ